MSQRTERILTSIKQIMSAPSDRDLQGRIGPSDLGDPCNYCLGSKMAGVKPQRKFSMYPWLGTAIHTLIEHLTHRLRFKLIPGHNELAYKIFGHPTAVAELHIENAVYIPGYGWCPAHLDFILPEEKCLVDWKSSSKKKVKVYQLRGVPTENTGQTLIYIHAARNNGYDVEAAVLVYIPRDTADLDDLWAYEVMYDEAEVQSIIDRAAAIWLWVEAGRWQELDKDPGCYNCFPGYFG